MPEPTTSQQHIAPSTTPCACCRERPHDAVPDRDLDAYVCRECAPLLRGAERVLKHAGYPGSTMETKS